MGGAAGGTAGKEMVMVAAGNGCAVGQQWAVLLVVLLAKGRRNHGTEPAMGAEPALVGWRSR